MLKKAKIVSTSAEVNWLLFQIAQDDSLRANHEALIAKNIKVGGGCWLWNGLKTKSGYGSIKLSGHFVAAHRLSYAVHHRVSPVAKMVCHKCDNPQCVNPEHLFLGDAVSNAADMMKKGRHFAHYAEKTHCKHGHLFNNENTLLRPSGGRKCRACARDYQKRLREKTSGVMARGGLTT